MSLGAGFVAVRLQVSRLLANVARTRTEPVADLSLIAPPKPSYGYFSVVLSLATSPSSFLVARIPAPSPSWTARRVRVFVAGLAAGHGAALAVIILDRSRR